MEIEKIFLLKPQDCYFVTIIKCPEKRWKLRLLPQNKERNFSRPQVIPFLQNNTMRTVLYYKRKNFHFSFTHHTERKRSASYLRKQMLHIVKRQWNNASSEKAFYEARLCRMKRSLFRLHFFCLDQGKKNGRGCFNCSENISQAQNGCKLVKNGYRFVKLRKHLYFCFFTQQRKIFSSTERTFSPKQLQNAPKKRC